MKKMLSKGRRIIAIALTLALSVTGFSQGSVSNAASKKYVKSMSLSKSSVTLTEGKKAKVKATVKVSGSVTKKVTVKSSKPSVASVKVGKASKKGVSSITIAAKKKGSTIIKVTTSGKNKSKKKVTKKIKVKVNKKENTPPSETTGGTSSNTTPVAPTATPTLPQKPLATPTATATEDAAATPTLEPTPTINWDSLVTSIAFEESSYTVDVEKTVQTVVKILPKEASQANISYSTVDKGIATISSAGVITGISAGETVVTATVGDLSASAKVVVKSPISLTLSDTEITLGRNQAQTITANLENVTWSSDNTSVATVDANGTIKGISAGTAIITASYNNGELTTTCVVTVSKYDPENDGTTLSVFNPIKNNDDTVIENTVLVNQDMTIQAYVQNNNTPSVGARVKLALDEIENYLVDVDDFEIKVNGATTNTALTDETGIAEFTISYKDSIDSTYDNLNSCPYISMSASATVDNQPADRDITIKFASVLRQGVQVDNNHDNPYGVYDNIIPFDGHAEGDDGIQTSYNTNDYYCNEYVSSQQIGNDVYLSATPYFVLPPEKITTEAKFNITFPDKDVTTGQSDVEIEGPGKTETYSIYNAYRDKTTTTTVANIPEGLVSMSVQFKNISISKYSALHVDLYELTTGKSIYTWSKSDYISTNVQDEAVDIKQNDLSRMDGKGVLVISLESPGQVDVDTTGYVLSKITGDFNSNATSSAELIEIMDSVEWTDVTEDSRYTVSETLTYSEVANETNGYLKEYVGLEGGFIKDNSNYTFAYKLPVYNSNSETANALCGNALITATYTSAAGEKKVATYAYPCIRELDSSNVPTNSNILKPKTDDVKAIFLGYDVVDENGNVQNNNGGIKTNGNEAIISSAENNKSGNIFVSAKIKINALAKEIKTAENSNNYDRSPLKGANSKYPLYSYVQFVAKPEVEVANDVIPTFYAVEDQYIVMTAEVKASNGEVQPDQEIKFYADGDDENSNNALKAGDKIGKDVTVKAVDTKTNNEGKAYMVLVGNEKSSVKNLRAEYKGSFSTFNTYAGNQKYDAVTIDGDEKRLCNLVWMDLGLAYQKDVTTSSWTYSFVSGKTEDVDSSSKVDKRWKVGFLPVTSVDGLFGYDQTAKTNKFVDITNVSVKYSFENDPSMRYAVDGSDNCEVVDNGKAVKITSQKIGETGVYGELKLDDDTFEVTYLDDLGVEQSFITVGVNNVDLNSQMFDDSIDLGGKIKYTMNWTPGEWVSDYVHPYGKRVYMYNDSVVYYRLHDKFENPIADTEVKVSATFDDGSASASAYAISANGSEVQNLVTAKTNEYGLIAIQIPKPRDEGELVVKCEIPDVFDKSSSIIFANVDPSVAPLEASTTANFNAANTKQIIVTFNNQLVAGLTEAQLKKLFVVENNKQDKLDIASISYNLKSVTITLADNSFVEGAKYTVRVNTGDECKLNGIVYVLYDTYGQAIQSEQATKEYTCKY